MNVDKSSLKRLIEQSRPNDILMLSIDALEKDGLKSCNAEMNRFTRKKQDYVIAVIRK